MISFNLRKVVRNVLLNDRKYEFFKEGNTIQDVLDQMNYIYPKLVVKVNGVLVEREDFDSWVLNENDDLKVHHLLAGG